MSEHIQEHLGRCMSAREVADYLQCDITTVYSNYLKLGGFKLGKSYKFFERVLVNALLQRTTQKVAGASQIRRQEVPQVVSHQAGSQTLGKRKEDSFAIKPSIKHCAAGTDLHDIFG